MGSLGHEDAVGRVGSRTVDENCDDEKKHAVDDEKKADELPSTGRVAAGAAPSQPSKGKAGRAGKGSQSHVAPLDNFALFKAAAKKKAAASAEEDAGAGKDVTRRDRVAQDAYRQESVGAAGANIWWSRYASEGTVAAGAAAAVGAAELPGHRDVSAFPVTFQAWEFGGFTAVCRIARAVHGEVWFVESEHGEPAAAKVLPTSTITSAQRRLASAGPSRAARERPAAAAAAGPPTCAISVAQRRLASGARGRAARERLSRLEHGDDDVEDAYNELAVLSYLADAAAHSPHLVQMLGVYQDDCSTYLVMEYCDEGELFDRAVPCRSPDERLHDAHYYLGQVLQAVRHLHRHNVGHRDVSLENVMLRKGRCVLIDFAQAVSLRSADGVVLRYFAAAGKPMYRGPELHIPPLELLEIRCPPEATAGDVVQVACEGGCRCEVQLPWGAVPGHYCWAEPHGYAAAGADVFSCGVCAFVLLTGQPPWGQALDTDPAFDCLRRFGAAALLQNRDCEERLCCSSVAQLLGSMLEVNPARRATADACLSSEWLGEGPCGADLL